MIDSQISVWRDLTRLVASLMKDGGAISPSVYDTAQLLRFWPPSEGVHEALAWLARQQHADGGWGSPSLPEIRDVPTIAALLAFVHYQDQFQSEKIVQQGLNFLQRHHQFWISVPLTDLPVGIELILPLLVQEAKTYGLAIPTQHYEKLIPIREKKLAQIAKLNFHAATPPTFSWEAWGDEPDLKWLDATGGVGHNPAATVHWLHLAKAHPELKEASQNAERFLKQAARATGLDIPGVVPSAYPIDRFEQIFVLHTLLMAGLLHHPTLHAELEQQIDDLARALTAEGFGFSDTFTTDGDNTAAAMAVLQASRGMNQINPLSRFVTAEHFWGYIGELQVSHSVTARSIFTLTALGEDTTKAEHFLLSQQLVNGAWPGDKWNISPYYGTCLAAFALQPKGELYGAELQAAADFLQESQLPTGGWSINQQPAMTDTAYALLALNLLKDCVQIDPKCISRGHLWLTQNYRPYFAYNEERWLNKQQYEPYRIDWGFMLAAMLTVGEPVYA